MKILGVIIQPCSHKIMFWIGRTLAAEVLQHADSVEERILGPYQV